MKKLDGLPNCDFELLGSFQPLTKGKEWIMLAVATWIYLGNPMGLINKDFINSFLTAGIACSAAQTIMAPVDRVKLLLQLQHSAVRKDQLQVPYSGLVTSVKRIIKEQGFLSLWRGNMANVIRCFPYQAVNFAFKDRFHGIFTTGLTESNKLGRVIASIAAGGFSGVIAIGLVYPLDLVRTRMAMNLQRQIELAGPSFVKTLKSTVKNDGVFGLYRGFPFSMSGVFLYRASFFGIYDTAKIITPTSYRNVYTAFLEAELAATSAGMLAYPFDTIRRNMMMQRLNQLEFKNSRECVRYIYEHEGLKGFYHGAAVNILRATGAALMLVFYDKLQEFFFGVHIFTKVAPVSIRKADYVEVEQMGCTGAGDIEDKDEIMKGEMEDNKSDMQESSVGVSTKSIESAVMNSMEESGFIRRRINLHTLIPDLFT